MANSIPRPRPADRRSTVKTTSLRALAVAALLERGNEHGSDHGSDHASDHDGPPGRRRTESRIAARAHAE